MTRVGLVTPSETLPPLDPPPPLVPLPQGRLHPRTPPAGKTDLTHTPITTHPYVSPVPRSRVPGLYAVTGGDPNLNTLVTDVRRPPAVSGHSLPSSVPRTKCVGTCSDGRGVKETEGVGVTGVTAVPPYSSRTVRQSVVPSQTTPVQDWESRPTLRPGRRVETGVVDVSSTVPIHGVFVKGSFITSSSLP